MPLIVPGPGIQSTDEVLRDHFIENGSTPDEANALVVEYRQGRRRSGANAAVTPARVASDMREIEDKLRAACPVIAKRAETVAGKMGALAVKSTISAAANLRDGPMGALAVAISKAMPHSGVVFEAVRRRHPDGSGSPWQWDDRAFAARELSHAVAEGATVESARIIDAARDVTTIAAEARSWIAALGARAPRRPTNPALDAAEELYGQGFSWAQIAELLDRRDLDVQPHTPEIIRKSVLARRRRRGRKAPATK